MLSRKISLAELRPELVEEEAMKFLRRLFGEEQLRRPLASPLDGRRANGTPLLHAGSELIRL